MKEWKGNQCLKNERKSMSEIIQQKNETPKLDVQQHAIKSQNPTTITTTRFQIKIYHAHNQPNTNRQKHHKKRNIEQQLIRNPTHCEIKP